MIKIGDKKIPIVINASGCWVTNPLQIQSIALINKCVVSKTCTLEAKGSNPLPNFIEFGEFSINCKGLPNLGYTLYRNLWKQYNDQGIVYIMSLDCSDINGLSIMLQDYDHYLEKEKNITNDRTKELVELNISCPNKSKNSQQRIIGYDLKYLDRILHFIRNLDLRNINIGLKLPPYIDRYQLEQLSGLLISYNTIITYIVCSNSLPNCMPIIDGEKKLSMGIGGMSGTPLKMLSLSNIQQLSKLLVDYNIKIMGCGGIESTKDIDDYLKVGATCVQIGRSLYLNGVHKLVELNNSYLKKSKL